MPELQGISQLMKDGQAQASVAPPFTVVATTANNPELNAQFNARVAKVFALLDAAIEAALSMPALDPETVEELRHALHQLAGTAAFFGQVALGTEASDMDQELGGGPSVATPAFLLTGRAALRHLAS